MIHPPFRLDLVRFTAVSRTVFLIFMAGATGSVPPGCEEELAVDGLGSGGLDSIMSERPMLGAIRLASRCSMPKASGWDQERWLHVDLYILA